MENIDNNDSKKENDIPEKKEYRTPKKAGKVDNIPPYLPVITNELYRNAMTLNDDDKAYLQPFTNVENLVYENGILYFEGLPASAAKLQAYFSKTGLENFDLPLLRAFYAVLLNRFVETWNEDKTIEEIITIYYPDLVRQLGYCPNVGKQNAKNCINSIMKFQNIMGIIDRGKRGSDIIPVLVYLGNDVEKNTIRFSSPYMVRLIQDIYNVSVRKSKYNTPVIQKNGKPNLLPAYSYMIRTTIAKEKNKKAVEIVFIVVALIEKCGNNVPHIKARTIIERNPLLSDSIENCSETKNINLMLSRSFTKAWELLSTQTELKKYYKNIQLPDVNAPDFKKKWIPTSSTLDMIFTFEHEGKKRS